MASTTHDEDDHAPPARDILPTPRTGTPLDDWCQQPNRKTDLARALGITVAAVRQWVRVPDDKLVDVERITGIPREALRPDLFIRTPNG